MSPLAGHFLENQYISNLTFKATVTEDNQKNNGDYFENRCLYLFLLFDGDLLSTFLWFVCSQHF